LQQNAGNALAHAFYGHLLAVLGDMDQALQHTERATILDPMNDLVLSLHAAILMVSDNLDAADKVLEESLLINPNNMLSLHVLEIIHFEKENFRQSVELLELFYGEILPGQGSLQEIYRSRGYRAVIETLIPLLETQVMPQTFSISQLYIRLEKWDEAVSWLERAYESHDSDMPYAFISNESNKAILSDPRMVALAGKMGLPITNPRQR